MPTAARGNLAAVFSKILALLISLLLMSYFFSMALGLFLIYFMPQGAEVAAQRVVALPLSLFMVVNFAIPLDISAGIFFLLLWVLYLGAFFLAWLDEPTLLVSVKILGIGGLDVRRSNYLAVMPLLSSIVLVAVVVLQTLQESAGVQTGGLPPEPPVLLFLFVSYAPLVEEFSYRITTIGILNGLYLVRKGRTLAQHVARPTAARLLLLAIWKPESVKEALGLDTIRNSGVRRGISAFEWLLLAVTSLAFGAVHYLAGGGWEIGKISTAALSGFAMGFVYLRYGAYAPVLLHWFFNYYLGSFDLAYQLNLAWFNVVSDAIQLLNLSVGTLVAVMLTVGFLLRLRAPNRRER